MVYELVRAWRGVHLILYDTGKRHSSKRHSFVRRLDADGIGAAKLHASVSVTFRDVTIEGFGGGTVERLRGRLPFAQRVSPSVILTISVRTNFLHRQSFPEVWLARSAR